VDHLVDIVVISTAGSTRFRGRTSSSKNLLKRRLDHRRRRTVAGSCNNRVCIELVVCLCTSASETVKCVICIYTVSTKKLYPCIHCHNSGKQRRILTKFYANTKTLNFKQVTKFQQNRSTSATATASLVRSLKSISVHYRHTGTGVMTVKCAAVRMARRQHT